MGVNIAAILPSRNEPATISAVTAAVDTAIRTVLPGQDAVIVHADSSDDSATSDSFTATATQAEKVALTELTRGKGAQLLAAARHRDVVDADLVLIADTDTRDPDPAVYAALIERLLGGASLAIADYPRHWDEANLTNHLARPLIAATGRDVPQPLAGDLALPGHVLADALDDASVLPDTVAAGVDGYGIDAFLLLTAASTGPPASVPFDRPKWHAASFSHLPIIFDQAVPVLLHLTASRTPPRPTAGEPNYRAADRALPPERLGDMLDALNRLHAKCGDYDKAPWPLAVALAWHAVRSGTPAVDAARSLWPHYLDRVRDWLTWGVAATTGQRADRLASTHAALLTAVTVGAS